MSTASFARLPRKVSQDLENAMSELRQSHFNRIDFPETHLQLGGMALVMRNPSAASGAFREVVTLDPQRIDAWVMLIRIAAATEGLAATRVLLSEALRTNPEDPQLIGIARELQNVQP
jgi:cytochrome c-type biogenesis protein CcmH/NrfG